MRATRRCTGVEKEKETLPNILGESSSIQAVYGWNYDLTKAGEKGGEGGSLLNLSVRKRVKPDTLHPRSKIREEGVLLLIREECARNPIFGKKTDLPLQREERVILKLSTQRGQSFDAREL